MEVHAPFVSHLQQAGSIKASDHVLYSSLAMGADAC